MKVFKLTVAFLVTLGFLSMASVQLTFSQDGAKTGKTIFEEAKCSKCHSVEKKGVVLEKKNDKYPDLSTITEGHDAAFWTKFLKKEETLNGKKHAIAFKGGDDDLSVLIQWLMAPAPTE